MTTLKPPQLMLGEKTRLEAFLVKKTGVDSWGLDQLLMSAPSHGGYVFS
jgi:hypothetical protein